VEKETFMFQTPVMEKKIARGGEGKLKHNGREYLTVAGIRHRSSRERSRPPEKLGLV